MKKYLLTIVLILVAVLASPAAETMVKEGMRWEVGYYSYIGPTGESYTNEFAVYNFTGKEVIDGIEYLQLYQTPAGPYLNKDYPKEGKMCLMREDEDGAVYIRITEDCIMAESHWLDYTIYPTDPRETFGFGYPKEEIAVFNPDWLKGGDVAMPVLEDIKFIDYELPYIDLQGFYDVSKSKMVSEDIIFKGKILKKYYFPNQFPATVFIEGIGYNIGFPFLPSQLYIYSDGGSCVTTYVSKVYDSDELIFTAADFKTPAYQPMIREDRVWEYWTECNRYATPDCTYFLNKFQFKGTSELDGKIYHNLVCTESQSWIAKSNGEENKTTVETGPSDNNEKIVGYLREEDGKVWIYHPEDYLLYKPTDNGWVETIESVSTGNEVLVYDFTALPQDEICPPAFVVQTEGRGDNFVLSNRMQLEVKSNARDNSRLLTITAGIPDYFTGDGSDCKFEYVEGVGNVGSGNFAAMENIILYQASLFAPIYHCGFNNQYDLEGNVVFEGRGMEIPKFEGVSAVASDAGNCDNRMYDLMGREINNPLPGTIYIRGGRKYVAR